MPGIPLATAGSRLLNASALAAGLVGCGLQTLGWAGGEVLLPLGFGLLLASTLAFTGAANAAAGVPRPLNLLVISTLTLALLSTLFKLLHWQGTILLSLLTLVLTLALSILLLATKAPVAGSRQLLTVVFVFFTLFFAALTLPGRPPAGPAQPRVERWPPPPGARAAAPIPHF